MKYLFTATFLILITLFIVISCKKKDDGPDPVIQANIDSAETTTRLGVETKIEKNIPTLNIYIQPPDGSWFSCSAGEDYQPISGYGLGLVKNKILNGVGHDGFTLGLISFACVNPDDNRCVIFSCNAGTPHISEAMLKVIIKLM